MPHRYRQRPYVPARDPLSAIPPSRHPFQFLVMLAMVLLGVTNLLTPGSEVLRDGLDPEIHKVWAGMVFLSGSLGLISAFWRDRITGLLMERLALAGLGVACPLYAVIVQIQRGYENASVGITITAFIGLAAWWRRVHVNRELRVLRVTVARRKARGESVR